MKSSDHWFGRVREYPPQAGAYGWSYNGGDGLHITLGDDEGFDVVVLRGGEGAEMYADATHSARPGGGKLLGTFPGGSGVQVIRSIPKGFRPPAQGCEERATLGMIKPRRSAHLCASFPVTSGVKRYISEMARHVRERAVDDDVVHASFESNGSRHFFRDGGQSRICPSASRRSRSFA